MRRAPLRCLSAVRAIDPSTTDRITVTDSDGPHTLKYLGEQQVRVIKCVDSVQPGQINPFFDPEAKLDKMLLKYAHYILDKTPEGVKLRTMGPSGA